MRHRCSPLAAFALLLVQPTAVGIAPCTAGRRFYTAFGWNSNCQLAPLSEPAKGKNLSALNFTCADGGLSNVVPLVHTRSLSPASVPCTVNPHGVRDGMTLTLFPTCGTLGSRLDWIFGYALACVRFT